MNKLKIFEFSRIGEYGSVLFIDADIVVHVNVRTLFDRIVEKGLLYVYTESTDQACHQDIYWSLNGYSSDELTFFKENSIHVFNAGCFMFRVDEEMSQHFANIRKMIDAYTGAFFYEQSFMNVYFNTINKTERSVLTAATYVLFPKNIAYPGRLVHFCGIGSDGGTGKLNAMNNYIRDHLYVQVPQEAPRSVKQKRFGWWHR